MDSESRKQYESLSEEDWVELGYQGGEDPGLTRKLHPLFQRTNTSRPVDARFIWPQYRSEAEYDAFCVRMGPVLQLASNILDTPASLEFLYQVAHSERQDARHDLDEHGRPYQEFGWGDEQPTVMQHVWAKEALRRLARSLAFRVSDTMENPAIVAETAHTLVGFQQGVLINEASSRWGMASRITLNKSFLDRLAEVDAQDGDFTSQKMSLQLKLAVTICHEIAHALANAVDSELLQKNLDELHAKSQAIAEGREYQLHNLGTDEPFYRAETVAEIGNSWENQVFGGKITWAGQCGDPMFVSKWPSFQIRIGADCPRRGKEARSAREYVMPFHFVANLHRQSFWDQRIRDDVTALHVKRTIGIHFANQRTDEEEEDEELLANESEEEWPQDRRSTRVDRERRGVLVLDPSGSRANETAEERDARELTAGVGKMAVR